MKVHASMPELSSLETAAFRSGTVSASTLAFGTAAGVMSSGAVRVEPGKNSSGCREVVAGGLGTLCKVSAGVRVPPWRAAGFGRPTR